MENSATKNIYSPGNIAKAIIMSAIGVFCIFIKIDIGGTQSIPLDHLISWIQRTFPTLINYAPGVVAVIGTFYSFFKGDWKKDKPSIVFQMLKFLSIAFVLMYFLNKGPAIFMDARIVPFFFYNVLRSAILIQITGPILLMFIANHGLMEFIGVYVRPFMRKIFQLPGMSAVNAVACFIGSYMAGIGMTNALFKEGKYSNREIVIVLTGFGTTSATFMVLMAKTMGIMDHWMVFFWLSVVTCCVATIITERIPPISKIRDFYWNDKPNPEKEYLEGSMLHNAIESGLTTCAESGSIVKRLIDSAKEGVICAMGMLPLMASVSILGLVLIYYTPLFDIIGYMFYPVTALLGWGGEAMLIAKAAAVGLVDQIAPCAMLAGATCLPGMIAVCVSCVTVVIYIAGSLPCFLAADCEISIGQYIIVGIERMYVSLLFSGLVGNLLVMVGLL